MAKKNVDPVKGNTNKKDNVNKIVNTLKKDTTTTITTPKGNVITNKDLEAWKKSGLDFGNKKALGEHIDTYNITKKEGKPKDSVEYGSGKSKAKMSVEDFSKVKDKLGIKEFERSKKEDINLRETDRYNKIRENTDLVRKTLTQMRKK
jgi:hypothetical protein